MQAATAKGARLHREYDRVPKLGVRAGEEGDIRRLTYPRVTAFAFVMMTCSTGQPNGWVVVQARPEREVRSFAAVTG